MQLVQGCSLDSDALIKALLQLAVGSEEAPGIWLHCRNQLVIWPLLARLAEAAELGRFFSPDSPLGAPAANMTYGMLEASGQTLLFSSLHHRSCAFAAHAIKCGSLACASMCSTRPISPHIHAPTTWKLLNAHALVTMV